MNNLSITEEIRNSLEEFMADRRLVALCEAQRTADEVLDVINLNENQHSDILSWLFDAKEGHGQGDEILRDLLTYASAVARKADCALNFDSQTAQFFVKWSPSKLRSASLGAAFSARELGMQAKERVDLFVIDPQNKFVLIIENKAGTSHSKEQLEKYLKSFEEKVGGTPGLSEYNRAYIALDREYDVDDDSETTKVRPEDNQWVHISYEWLTSSAKRALHHVERGNTAAGLVVSYCNRQTDWEDPRQEDAIQQAIALYRDYPAAVKYLVNNYGRRPALDWFNSPTKEDEYSLFMLQNRGVAEILKESHGMAAVRAELLQHIKELSADNVRSRRVTLIVCPKGWEKYAAEKNKWPVYFLVRYSKKDISKFKLILWWRAMNVRGEDAAGIREKLAKTHEHLKTHAESQRRRLVIDDNLSLDRLIEKLREQLSLIGSL